MKNTQLHYLIRNQGAARGFKAGVSLHSHTMHSIESMAFIEKIARSNPLFNWFFEGQLKKYSNYPDLGEQVRRMWWTSPLAPAQAYQLERDQIVETLGLDAFVSLTDHDSIEAPLLLQMVADTSVAPISVEWTVPYGETYFHIGVHNMPPNQAVEMMQRMQRFTAEPDTATMHELFDELNSIPDLLIIFNHPYWDQPWLGDAKHTALTEQFVVEMRSKLHALEINGLRSWDENRRVVKLSRACGLPLISGGDRHGCEPNATLNLTNASTFSEFAEEIRGGATSHLLMMPQFHDPLPARVWQTLWDILRDHPDHVLGRVRWTERTFRHCVDGSVKPFTAFFPNGEPWLMPRVALIAKWMSSKRLRPAWQKVTAETSEAAL